MRHKKAGRHLNRDPEHRLSLRRNLARALIQHGRITTTLPKAKDLRPFVEKLITLAKKAAVTESIERKLHLRRQAMSKLPDKQTVKLLFEEIGPRYTERPGGYTRVIKRIERRLGDGGETAFIELLKEGEEKVRSKAARPAPAPAPAVSESPVEPEEEPTAGQEERSEESAGATEEETGGEDRPSQPDSTTDEEKQ